MWLNLGRGRSMSMIETILPGRSDMTITLSDSATASAMPCVTNTTVFLSASHIRSSS